MVHVALRVLRVRPHHHHDVLFIGSSNRWTHDMRRHGGDEIRATGVDGDGAGVVADGALQGALDDLDGFGLVEVLSDGRPMLVVR